MDFRISLEISALNLELFLDWESSDFLKGFS